MPHCPRCGSELKRIPPSAFERVLSRVYPMSRYLCKRPGCGFEGCIDGGDGVKKRMLILLFPLLFPVLGILVLILFRIIL